MARSCGIHIDQRRLHLVVLEGGARKHRVVTRATSELPLGVDPSDSVADSLRRIVKREKVTAENVALAVDSGMAAFRNMTVPFDDRSKIEEIIKYEVESELPQWDIDDVVVDFLVVGTKPGVESNLLVTAVPKPQLELQLKACERGGLEPGDAELDGSALFEAANTAGVLGEDAAQVLVHVGDSSTTVVVVDGGRLSSIRAIRTGAHPHAEEKAETAAASRPADEDEGLEQRAEDTAAVDHGEARLAQTAKRIRRELGRTVLGASTEHSIEAIYFCGHPLEGLMAEGRLFEVPVHALEAISSDGESDAGASEQTIAFGAALRALGAGVLEPHLRREGLRFSGKFERLELPLAVFSLLLCTLLGVKLIVTLKQIDWRDEGDVEVSPGDMQYWLTYSNMYLLPDPNKGYTGRLKQPSPELLNYLEKAEEGRDLAKTKFQELASIRKRLEDSVRLLQKKLGHISDVPQPQSALQGATMVLGVLDGLGERVGRFGIRGLGAEYKAGRDRSGADDRVEVRMDLDFFADSDLKAAENFTAFMRELRAKPWCTEFDERPSKPFTNGGGLAYDGLLVEVDVAGAIDETERGGE